MPISYHNADLFASRADAIVDPVNCVGVAGVGIAKAVRERFPTAHAVYAAACAAKRVAVGAVLTAREPKGPLVIFVPTKVRPAERSTIDIVEQGLIALRAVILAQHIPSVAMPALGCGAGGLDWEEVRPRIEAILGSLPVPIEVYLPRGAPWRGGRPSTAAAGRAPKRPIGDIATPLGVLATAGYGNAAPADWLAAMAAEPVDLALDVRLIAHGWAPEYREGAFLRALESSGAARRARHAKGLGNLAVRDGGAMRLADERQLDLLTERLGEGRSVLIICGCAKPEGCHRRMIAERVVQRLPGLIVVDRPPVPRSGRAAA
jgi:O-acetyl-ADP-ribose deacetylase (regulator of RNase III)